VRLLLGRLPRRRAGRLGAAAAGARRTRGRKRGRGRAASV